MSYTYSHIRTKFIIICARTNFLHVACAYVCALVVAGNKSNEFMHWIYERFSNDVLLSIGWPLSSVEDLHIETSPSEACAYILHLSTQSNWAMRCEWWHFTGEQIKRRRRSRKRFIYYGARISQRVLGFRFDCCVRVCRLINNDDDDGDDAGDEAGLVLPVQRE